MATGTVTLEKTYFETLLRRAQFHTGGVDYTTPVHLPTVTIPKADHDQLLDVARQYANLRQNLFRGGIAEETLAVLIKDDAPTVNENASQTFYSTVEETSDGGAGFPQQKPPPAYNGGGQDYTFGRNSNYTPRSDNRPRDTVNGFDSHAQVNDEYAFMPDGPEGYYDGESGNNDSQARYTRPQYQKFAKRTVLLANLPEGVTHSDVAVAVKGGMLLDIYLRTHDRAASVSFLEEEDAHEFFRYVKRHDLYIRNKRVEIRWSDRQFILPGHVANKIAIGATRNLVIRNCSPRHTEQVIRDDLEHIHNLVVINVTFKGQNAYISTNSVHNAMFARTCMMSRASYKGSKIEWANDECAVALSAPLQTHNINVSSKKKRNAPTMNRFQLLNMDRTEDGSEDGNEDNDTSGFSNPTEFTTTTAGIIT